MKLFKKIILTVLTVTPITAISYAANFSKAVTLPIVSQLELQELFFKKLGSDQLSHKYYDFIEANGITNFDDLLLEANRKVFRRLMKTFKKEFLEGVLMTAGASSIIPD